MRRHAPTTIIVSCRDERRRLHDYAGRRVELEEFERHTSDPDSELQLRRATSRTFGEE